MTKRIFLDASDLVLIADGKVQSTEVVRLHEAMATAQAGLVVSRGLIQDTCSRCSETTLERMVQTFESFGPLLLVTKEPFEVEPLTDDRSDIGTQWCANIREMILHRAATSYLTTNNTVQDRLHDVQATFQKSRVGTSRVLRSKADRSLFWQCVVTLYRGWLSEDPADVVSHWRVEMGIDERDAEAVLAALRTINHPIRMLRELSVDFGAEPTKALKALAEVSESPERNPGRRLAGYIAAVRAANVSRGVLRSDALDLEHAVLFPYVDIATCDRNTLDAVRRFPGALYPKKCQVLPSGRLSAVVAAINAL